MRGFSASKKPPLFFGFLGDKCLWPSSRSFCAWQLPDAPLTCGHSVDCLTAGVRHEKKIGFSFIKNFGSSGGDDALALTISKLTKWRISQSYLITDITVLLLSLSYIPLNRIAYSLVTVTVSSLVLDLVQRGAKAAKAEECA